MKPSLVSHLRSQAYLALITLLACLAALSAGAQTAAPSSWDAPAAQLAGQIASILGPGQAQIELTNRSTIPTSEIPTIRRAIDDALRAHNIKPGNAESANTLHITLSENSTERLWIAEILEGNQTQIAIIRLDKPAATGPSTAPVTNSIRLQRKLLWSSPHPSPALPSPSRATILAALEASGSLILLREDQILVEPELEPENNGAAPIAVHAFPILVYPGPMPRDPRGILVFAPGKITAYLPGLRCTAAIPAPQPANTAACETTDDPWPIPSDPASPQRAFYNKARNYFTGLLTPGLNTAGSNAATNTDLLPFYSAIPLTASGTASLLFTAIDGKPRLATPSSVKALTGSHDWGSDLALLTTSCGSTAILATSSGESNLDTPDSLRAYELHGSEAVAVSEPLPMPGVISALSQPLGPPIGAATGSLSPNTILAVLRIRSQDGEESYEVDRVSALCQ